MDRATATRDLVEDQVRVEAGPVTLEGNLGIPERARGVVLFAHGSGSGRHSPRNRFVAHQLRAAGLATLLVDLEALAQLGASVKQLVIVPGASHLFEEPGKLEKVARLAADWFARHLDLPAEAKPD